MRFPEQFPDWRNDRERRPSRLQYPDFLHPEHQSLQLTRELRPSRFQYPDPTPEVRKEFGNLVCIGLVDGLWTPAPRWVRSVITRDYRKRIAETLENPGTLPKLEQFQKWHAFTSQGTGGTVHQNSVVRWDESTFLVVSTFIADFMNEDYLGVISLQRRSFATGQVLQEVNATLPGSGVPDPENLEFGITSVRLLGNYPFYDPENGYLGVVFVDRQNESPTIQRLVKYTWEIGTNQRVGTAATGSYYASQFRQDRAAMFAAENVFDSETEEHTRQIWRFDLTPNDPTVLPATKIWEQAPERVSLGGTVRLAVSIDHHWGEQWAVVGTDRYYWLYDIENDTETAFGPYPLTDSHVIDATGKRSRSVFADAYKDWQHYNEQTEAWETYFDGDEVLNSHVWRPVPGSSNLTLPELETVLPFLSGSLGQIVGMLGEHPLFVNSATGYVTQFNRLSGSVPGGLNLAIGTTNSMLVPYTESDGEAAYSGSYLLSGICAGDDRVVLGLNDGPEYAGMGLNYLTTRPEA